MAHKTIINGTAYEITGGTALVNGTSFQIGGGGGRTSVEGTGFDIGFGVKWYKWNCEKHTTRTFYQYDDPDDENPYPAFQLSANTKIYKDYKFDSSRGFYGGQEYKTIEELWENYLHDINIYPYYVKTMAVYKIDGGDAGQYAVKTITWARAAYTTTTSYRQGTTNYGAIFSPEGELPEAGTLIEGSAKGDYCIIQVNGTCYYYTRA